MSSQPEKAVSYVLSKSVTEYMSKDVLMLGRRTQTRDAATMLRNYETDDIIVIDKEIHFRSTNYLSPCDKSYQRN